MARFDGSGPRGIGPMTGKGMGYCAGDALEKPFYGRGMGRGIRRRPGANMGFGRGMGNRFYRRGFDRYYVEDAEYVLDPKESLEEEKRILEDRLNNINGELENLNDK